MVKIKIGEVRRARELGKGGTVKYIWWPCPICHKPKWGHYVAGEARHPRCQSCARRVSDKKTNWKGGRVKTSMGYIWVIIYPNDFFYPMAKHKDTEGRYVLEHRLIMAQHLGRLLHDWEMVHHRNGIKDDNRIENLELTASIGEHSRTHSKGYQDGYTKGLADGKNEQIAELKTEVRLLRWQLREGRISSSELQD